MQKNPRARVRATIVVLLTSAGMVFLAAAMGAGASTQTRTQSADETDLVRLPGHVHQLAQARFDAGEAPAALPLHGLSLVLAKTPAQQLALAQLIADQQNSKSPQYHRWLSPAEYGSRFGASDASIASLSQWLTTHGFVVGTVPAARSHLPFSGSKSQVEAAFHTQIHLFNVRDEHHYANLTDPMIPAAFQPIIAAVRGLNDFHPHPGVRPSRAPLKTVLPSVGSQRGYSTVSPDTYYSGSDQYPGYVGPSDFVTLYDLAPAYQQGYTGAGVTIVITAQSDIDASVLTTFWTAFGVQGSKFGLPAQQFSSMPVPGGTDPGHSGDGNEDEAYLDTEIVGALAPGAKLVLVRDEDAVNAATYAIDQNLGAIVNVSFGSCESAEGSENTTVNSLFQQAVSQGITVTVSSADAGVETCVGSADLANPNDVNSDGFAVNGLASTPYDLAVGGTDFNPNTETTYWNTGNQSGTLESAISHIPEMVWNDSCANPVLAQYWGVSDTIAFCNTTDLPNVNPATANPYIEISGAGAGISSCVSSSNSGNCTGGYDRPSWQEIVVGMTGFTTRAIPDVAMIATRWLVCSYDTTPCDPTKAPTFNSSSTIKVLDGTSAAAPSVAAIVALVDQSQITTSSADGRQGLINTKFYDVARTEYGSATTLASCSASQGAISNAACVFYDVVDGSNNQPCKVSTYTASAQGSSPASTCATESGDAIGLMALGGVEAYAAGGGFDIATGLGSIDAANLIAAYKFASPTPPTGLSASALGTTVTLKWNADSSAISGFNLYVGTTSGQESTTPAETGIIATSTSLTGLTAGQTYYFEIAAVSAGGTSAPSNERSVTLVPLAPVSLAASATAPGTLQLSWAASFLATSYNVFEGTAASGESTSPAKSSITGTFATITGLTPGQQYFFTVKAINAGGSSAASAEASGTVLPAAPTGVTATAGNGAVSLAWTASAGAASYNVYRGTTAGGEGTTAVQTGLTAVSATVSGLTNGTKYYFTVAAVDAGGTSVWSTEASATPAAPASSGGGGGAVGWGALAALAIMRLWGRRPAIRARRTV